MKICFILFSLYLFLQWGYGCDRYCPRAPLPNWQLCPSFRRIIRTTVLGNVFFLSFFFIEDSEPQNPDTQLCLNDELRCHKVQGPYSRCRYLFWSATKKKKRTKRPKWAARHDVCLGLYDTSRGGGTTHPPCRSTTFLLGLDLEAHHQVGKNDNRQTTAAAKKGDRNA